MSVLVQFEIFLHIIMYLTIANYAHFIWCRPRVVNERMICHAIIGKNPLKERIMTVDVTATFIAPLLEFSSKKLLFSLYQVIHATCTWIQCMVLLYFWFQPLGSRLEQHTKDLSVKNVSPLPVTSVLMCSYPFSILKDGTALAQMVHTSI